MRQTTPMTWPVLLAAAAIGLLSGCASRQTKPNPNVVTLPSPAASAPVSAGPTAAARKGLATAAPVAAAPSTSAAGPAPATTRAMQVVSPTITTATPPAAVPPLKSTPLPKWTLNENDKTLKVALERWSQAAGWRLLWELGVDYRIGAAATVDGNFEDAVATVMRNLDQAEVPPKAIFYRGNQVVRVVARGME